jgi:hypothetical protein
MEYGTENVKYYKGIGETQKHTSILFTIYSNVD